MGDSDDGKVIEGEIVPHGPRGNGPGGRANGNNRTDAGQERWNRANSNGRGQSSFADPDTVKAAIADVVRGMSYRAVGKKYGIGPQTVSNWCKADVGRRIKADVDALRAEASQHLDTVRHEAWGMYEAGKTVGQPKVMAEALNRVESATNSKAKLDGAIRPTRVDVQVTAVTEAEQELQEMISEARVKAAADEAAVIAAANEDPDL